MLKANACRLLVGIAGVIATLHAHAENWSAVTGRQTLTELVSGATATIGVKPGITATGTYFADGSATAHAWGEEFDRT